MLDPDQLQYVHRVWQVPSEVDSGTQPPNWEAFVDGLAEHGSAYDSTNRLHLQGTNRFRYLNSMVRALKTTAQNTNAIGSFVTITFDKADDFDTDTLHDTSSNTSRLTAAIAGKYLVVGNVYVNFSSVVSPTSIQARFIKNGSTATDYGIQYFGPPTGALVDGAVVCSAMISLVVTDYVEFQVTVTGTSGTFDITNVATLDIPAFGMAYLGE